MWRVIPGQSLRWREWDDEAVLFNELSGATHHLGTAALCVLEVLRDGPAGQDALADSLRAAFNVDETELPDQLAELLDSLVRLDLVEAC
ncbi:HPr-rel-A system PqqD family peptide chaperone [Massilia sp. IC2-476]|uniref:HPr-rel-A system PqqD family peptide chaperone n=1 Tax=Massilia sp. IC2-476 TaxID=2887199 RepID=UPI001D103EF2|nr:HPr-rel-A system PqqD family peptide chaperone [Massilia sp. IC2-476]MCC2973063.1 HPr-rel-A system PqqD family peptide chaperone [Massilia sp. IC2-476]